MSAVLGESALSDLDKLYANFANEFEQLYISQGFDQNRTIEQTMEIGWQLLRILPKTELKRIKTKYIEKYY